MKPVQTGPDRSRNKNPDLLVWDDMFLDRFGPVWIGMDWMDHHTNYIPIKYRIIQYSMSTQLISSPATIRSLPVLDGMLLDRSGPVWTGWDHTLMKIIIDDDYTQDLGVLWRLLMSIIFNLRKCYLLDRFGPVWTGYGWFQLIYITVVIIIFIPVKSTCTHI